MREQFPIHNILVPKQQQQAVEEPTLPEIALQQEMREHYTYAPSSEKWYLSVLKNDTFEDKDAAELLLAQKAEIPELTSAVLERTCNLRCAHCLYQDESSSAPLSRAVHLDEVIANVVQQMPEKSVAYVPQFLSCGRILRAPHLELFRRLRDMRPDVRLGVIDNGTYTKLLSRWPEGFKFDWMDISIDGPEDIHNTQRQSAVAFKDAMNGLREARGVTRPSEEGGRVTSLFTLTTLNAGSILETADLLLGNRDGKSLVDQFRVTTLSPTNEVNTDLDAGVEDLVRAWGGIRQASERYNTDGQIRFHFSVFQTETMEKLAAAVGEKKIVQAFSREGDLQLRANFLDTTIDGVPMSYLPLSIWTPEEFLIEADGACRTAYEGMFTLDELRSGIAKDGRDTRPYTIEQLTPESDLRSVYERGVDQYWSSFGKRRIAEEKEIWGRILKKAAE